MVKKSIELVEPGQNAVVIFTRGPLFVYDEKGEGTTGNWTAGAGSLDEMDKVIIYKRDDLTGNNHIYMGDYGGWKQSPEPRRKIIRFSKLKEFGQTSSNWAEFGGSKGGLPFFYNRK
jgi:hypothetical protein